MRGGVANVVDYKLAALPLELLIVAIQPERLAVVFIRIHSTERNRRRGSDPQCSTEKEYGLENAGKSA